MEETRDPGMGGADVHSHVGFQPSKGEGMSGKYDASSSGGTSGAVDTARERAGEMADEARERMDEVRGRAGEMMDQARSRASDMLEQAEDSPPVQMARDNPLPALGLAFAVGFLLAGSSDSNGRFGKAKHQVRGAVMGGLSAAISQEVRGMMKGQGGGDLLSSLLGGQERGGQGQRQGGMDTGSARA